LENGIEITFFGWPRFRVAPNHPGAGEVSTTELRVHGREALDWWAGHLEEHGVQQAGIEQRNRHSFIDFMTSRASGSGSLAKVSRRS
jgi:glyoxalase family protein